MSFRVARVGAASTIVVLAALASCAGMAAPAGAAVASFAQQSPSVPPSPGGIGVQLLPETGSKETPSPYITNQLAPGDSVTRQITVNNSTTGSVQVALYAAAASVVDNNFTIANGHEANDASSYTTVTPSSVTLAAGTAVVATVTINVAKDAAPGPQYAVVWAEASSGGTGIVEVNRVGIREYLSIGAGGLASPDFSLSEVTAGQDSAGHRVVNATVHNTGGRVLNLSGSLTLSDGPAGTSTGPFPATIPNSLVPDASTPVTVTLPAALQAGPWTALLTVKASAVTRTATATLTFPEATTAPGASTAAPGGIARLWPIPVVGVLALAGLGGLGLRARTARLTKRDLASSAAASPT